MVRQPAEDGYEGEERDEPADSPPAPLLPSEEAIPGEEVTARAATEAQASREQPFGELGRPFSHRSPFYTGLVGALGVAVAFVVAWAVFSVRGVLLLIVMALFVAVGLDPLVRWLQRRGLPRWSGVVLVLLAAVAVAAGFLASAVPVLVTQVTQLTHHIPHYLHTLSNRHSFIGRLNHQYHLESRLRALLSRRAASLATTGILGVGRVVVSLVGGLLIVGVLTVYFLADLPRIRRGIYSLAPRSRRARTVLLTDEIFTRVGGYVLGDLLTSVIAGLGTWVWAEIFGIPFPLLLACLVALFDLVPIVGSTIGGVIVALVALVVSLPIALATAAFYALYRLLEDYLITPRVMRATVQVPGVITVVATLIGGALLGIIGALIAIPAAAALKLVVEQVTIPRLDRD